MFINGKPRGQNTFITFNYDTVLEDALQELNLPFDHSHGFTLEEGKIPVLKLHGSVSWGQKLPGETGYRDYRTAHNLLTNEATPMLVPPTWKKVFAGPLSGIWDTASRKLATATRIIVI